jgi:CubicO group peptidase (beta-lactamase class C family)
MSARSAAPASPTARAAAIEAARASLDAEIEAQRADGSIPGLALAVTDGTRTLIDRQYGAVELGFDRPVTPHTLFEIGSIGKTFTALVILALEAEGRLRVDDPVIRHLPWFRVPRTGDRITIHHLLSHTAGITAGSEGTPEARAQVWQLRDLPPGSAPGRRFHYSNLGFKILGLVIEALEGEPYPAVIQRRILDPLRMRDTAPAITNEIRARMAVGYAPFRDDAPWTEGDPLAPATWLETGTADGSIASTGGDMATFVRFLMHDPDGHVARMATPVPALGAWGYGYGLSRREVDGRTFIGHTGGMVGFISGMAWDPDAGIGAVVLQSGPGHGPNALARLAVRRTHAALEGRDPASEAPEDLAALDAEDDAPVETKPAWVVAPELRAKIVGTYRSHDPWEPVFRVEDRTGVLWAVFPLGGGDGVEEQQPLVPMARGWYRLGADRLGPERLRFDLEIEGRMIRAWLSGWPYFRVDDRTS